MWRSCWELRACLQRRRCIAHSSGRFQPTHGLPQQMKSCPVGPPAWRHLKKLPKNWQFDWRNQHFDWHEASRRTEDLRAAAPQTEDQPARQPGGKRPQGCLSPKESALERLAEGHTRAEGRPRASSAARTSGGCATPEAVMHSRLRSIPGRYWPAAMFLGLNVPPREWPSKPLWPGHARQPGLPAPSDRWSSVYRGVHRRRSTAPASLPPRSRPRDKLPR